MPYNTPSGNNINFNFSIERTDTPGNAVNFYFSDAFGHQVVSTTVLLEISVSTASFILGYIIDSASVLFDSSTIDESIVLPLTHLNSDNIVLEYSISAPSVEILPDIINDNLLLDNSVSFLNVGGNTASDLPVGISKPTDGFVWGGFSDTDIHFSTPWGLQAQVDPHLSLGIIIGFYNVSVAIEVPFGILHTKDIHTDSSWDEFFPTDLYSIVPWKSFFISDVFYTAAYFGNKKYDNEVVIPYCYSAVHVDISTGVDWGLGAYIDHTHIDQWGNSRLSVKDHEVPWGPRELYKYCYSVYVSPVSPINFYFPTKYPLTKGAYILDFELDSYSTDPRCNTIHNHTGSIDTKPPAIVVIPPPRFFSKKVYYMLNTVLVKTLPDNVEIEVTGVSIKIDRDSWLWQFSMVLGDKSYLSVLSPANGVFKTIQIQVNGWQWVFLVESWQENIGFAKGSYTVSGRSPSLVLGDPICTKKSYIHTEASTGSYIIQDILDGIGSGFSVAFSAYHNTQTGFDPVTEHWNIPANTFSYSQQTDIEGIKILADSIGAYVQSHRNFYDYGGPNDFRVLEILPKFAWQPWNWDISNVSLDFKLLDKSLVRELGTSFIKNPDYYAAYIVGEAPKDGGTTGTFCNVYKYEKGPNTAHAPVSSSMLYTTDMIAQEKGRMIIGESGMWKEHTIRIFSLFPDGTSPGLLSVGDLINVTENLASSFVGLVTSVAIDAISNSSAFSVAQTVTVIQYIGEWGA